MLLRNIVLLLYVDTPTTSSLTCTCYALLAPNLFVLRQLQLYAFSNTGTILIDAEE